MKRRYLFVEFDCGFCKEYLNVIDIVNSRLKPEDKVKIIDLTNLKETGIPDNFLAEKFNVENVPFLYIDGFIILGESSKEFIKSFLNEVFKEEFVV